jgi:hypothetical protein
LFGFPSQEPQPNEQVGEQADAAQAVVPYGFVHTTPHAPQLFGSEVRSRQTLAQQAWPKQPAFPVHAWP